MIMDEKMPTMSMVDASALGDETTKTLAKNERVKAAYRNSDGPMLDWGVLLTDRRILIVKARSVAWTREVGEWRLSVPYASISSIRTLEDHNDASSAKPEFSNKRIEIRFEGETLCLKLVGKDEPTAFESQIVSHW